MGNADQRIINTRELQISPFFPFFKKKKKETENPVGRVKEWRKVPCVNQEYDAGNGDDV